MFFRKLGCVFVVSLCFFSRLCIAQQTWSPELQAFLDSPDTHPRIPNCVYAGYHAASKDLPKDFPRAGRDVANVKEYGAVGNGVNDDTGAVLRAITSGKKFVYLPEGTYVLSDMLRLTTSNRIIFGDGTERTRLLFKKSLSDVLGAFLKPNESYNRWSNHGGLIWISPGDVWTKTGKYRYQLPGPDGMDIGWINKELIGSVCSPAHRGDDIVKVKLAKAGRKFSTEGLSIFQWHETSDYSFSRYLGGHPSFLEYDFSEATALQKDWQWTVGVRLVRQRNDTLTLKLAQPLRADIRQEWRVSLYKPTGAVPYIEEVGLSDLSIVMDEHRDFIHHQDLGFNGINFQRAFNCWVKNVEIVNADNSIILESSKNVSLDGITLNGKTKRHHGIYFRFNVHDCILSDFHIGDSGNEALSISYRSSGNVFRKGTVVHGKLDSHRGVPFDHIRTDITLVHNDGNAGGGANAGPRNGARVVHWNIRVTSGDAKDVYQPYQHSSSVLAGIQGVAVDSTFRHMPPGDKGTQVIFHGEKPYPEDLYLFQKKMIPQ